MLGSLDFANNSAWLTPFLLAFKNADPIGSPATYPYTGFYQWGNEWQVNARDEKNQWAKNVFSINLDTNVANFLARPTVNGANIALTSDIPISDGNLELQPASGEGGQILLQASKADKTNNGIAIDTANGDFRIFGLESADGTSRPGYGSVFTIDPYDKTISGGYTFDGSVAATGGAYIAGRYFGGGDDEGLVIGRANNNYAGLTLGSASGVRSVFYLLPDNSAAWRYNNGSASFDIKHPGKSGTIALTSDLGRSTAVNEADTNYTTLMARGSSLNSAETNPAVNGAIAWTYE